MTATSEQNSYAKKKISISKVKRLEDDRPEKLDMTWQDFIYSCSEPEERGKLDLSAYLESDYDTQQKRKNGVAIIGGTFIEPNTREIEDLESISVAALDLNDGHYDWDALLKKLKGIECVVVTSYSNSKKHGKYRVFLLLDKPIKTNIESTYGLIIDSFASLLGPHLDEKSWLPNQVFYRPSYPPGGAEYFKFAHISGKPIITADFNITIPDQKEIDAVLVKEPIGSRTADDYNSKVSWSELLLPLKWTLLSTKNGIEYWARPDKRRKVAAVVCQNTKIFYVHSTTSPKVSPFEGNKAYKLFTAYTLINHDGLDYKAASKQLKLDGYGKTVEKAVENEKSEDVVVKKQGAEIFPLVPFPFEWLPVYFRRLVKSYSKALQCPPEFMAMNFMTIASGAAGNSVTLAIKASWKPAPFLWFGIVDKSGSGKTHPIRAAMKPINDRQAAELFRHANEMVKYKQKLTVYKKDRKKNKPPAEPNHIRHYYSPDFTIESLIPMFQVCARGVIFYVDELAGLLKSLNQYRGGKGSDDEKFLSLFDGGPLKSDRKGGSNWCSQSGVAVVGGIQPGVFSVVFGDKEYENGMVYRFLPMQIDVLPPKFTLDDISEENKNKWSRIIDWMYNIETITDPNTGCIISNDLTVDDAGMETWTKFHDRLSDLHNFMPKRFRGYIPKLKTYCLKFMAVLHLLECYPKGKLTLTVEKSTVLAAIKLTRYFAGQAMQLTTKASIEKNPYAPKIMEALILLEEEFKKGKLLVNRVRERMNELLPHLALENTDHKQIIGWLEDMGLVVDQGHSNKSYVFWDANIIRP